MATRAASRRVTKTITAASMWTGPLVARIGKVYVSVTGAFTHYVTVQRSHDNGAVWTFVRILPPGGGPVYVENVVDGAWYRIGFDSDGFTSGSAAVELAQ